LPLFSSDMTLEQSTFAARAMTGLSPIPNVTMSATLASPGTIFLTAGTPLELIAYGIEIMAKHSRTNGGVKSRRAARE
jgi:hypothetical protein